MNKTKILLFDIETAPNLGYAWGKWEQNIIENVKDWYILSFSYKWLGEKTVYAYSLPNFSNYKKNREDDSELIKKLWRLMDEADIVIAHNGDEFDIKKANARLIMSGILPPKPYKTIDTKKVAKRHFKFDSNKLDELGRYLGLGRKIQTGGFDLWKGCMAGNSDSWKKMVKYNKQDVVLLEKVYLKLRPWINNFPIVSSENGQCRNCEGRRLHKRGFGYTKTARYQRLQCYNCGAWSTGEKLLNKISTK